MASVRQKGKIPAAEWPAIAARQHAGEPLAHIAKDYGCTAPAIRYIVKRVGAGVNPSSAPRNTESREDGERRTARTAGTRSLVAGAAAAKPARVSRVGPRTASAQSKLTSSTCERIVGEIAAFLCALDAATGENSPEALNELRRASEHLMRAAARVRIEIESLSTI